MAARKKKKAAKKVAVRRAPAKKSAERAIGGDARVDPKGAIRVKAATPQQLKDGRPARTSYWCGTKPNCPIQNLTMGGINFDRFSGNPVFDSRGNPDRPLDYGQDHLLTDEQVERIITAVQNHVIRVFPADERGRVRGRLMNVTNHEYRPNVESDIPIAAYLYMVESDYAGHSMRRACSAPTMIDEDIEDLPGDDQLGNPQDYDSREESEELIDGVEIGGPSPVGEVP